MLIPNFTRIKPNEGYKTSIGFYNIEKYIALESRRKPYKEHHYGFQILADT